MAKNIRRYTKRNKYENLRRWKESACSKKHFIRKQYYLEVSYFLRLYSLIFLYFVTVKFSLSA